LGPAGSQGNLEHHVRASLNRPGTSLDEAGCFARLAGAGHGVLATVHPVRGVDAVPVVFALDRREILIPVDTVKPKRTTDLQRLRNLADDPRCALLVDHYSDDWDRLWWVRVIATGSPCPPERFASACSALAKRHPPYAQPGSIVSVSVLTPQIVTGWQASGAWRA
jgi:PPOX class probable F420-dependent enzyme